MWLSRLLLCLSLLLHGGLSVCPYLQAGTPPANEDPNVPSAEMYNEAVANLDMVAVFDDLYQLMTTSQPCWPADEDSDGKKSYAGLFLRLAWHSAGTFRATDGEGGSFGGRQRYQPESAWVDNVNLDKARALLGPIKEKYGDALSWGDLMIFAGTAGILAGNGPVTRVCAGRMDDRNGAKSEILTQGCPPEEQGNCSSPNGQAAIGLIYVNPEGFLGNPDPLTTANHVREIFGRMGMNDWETVALIGGGHAFGKCHGPCPLGPGPGPDEEPFNPWPGMCGDNFPTDAYTSGLEGTWTTYPFSWDNEYFTQLRDDEFTLLKGPGDKYQWRNNRNGLLMLTTDLAFVYDDDYKPIAYEYARNINRLNEEFSKAWEKLVTSGGSFVSNGFCVDANDLKPPPPRGRDGKSQSRTNTDQGQGQGQGQGGGKGKGKGGRGGN